jgi:hypothetical protein
MITWFKFKSSKLRGAIHILRDIKYYYIDEGNPKFKGCHKNHCPLLAHNSREHHL